jgi:hypothetical protein
MCSANIAFDHLRDIVSSLKDHKIHVAGDLVIDTYTETSVVGSKAKTLTMSVLHLKKTDYVGGEA